MISAEREEKFIKTMGILVLILMPVFNGIVKDDEVKLFISIPLAIIMGVLATRKFIRDRKEGKPLKRYYIALGFVILSVITFVFAIYSV